MKENINGMIVESLQKALSPIFIYIFGSHANGTVRPESDIDIAYFSDQKIDDYQRFMLAQQLADQLSTEVDLIDLKQASTVFQVQIIENGKIIFCNNEYKRMTFEMLALKMYAKLNEERQVILDRIQESGEVYENRRNH